MTCPGYLYHDLPARITAVPQFKIWGAANSSVKAFTSRTSWSRLSGVPCGRAPGNQTRNSVDRQGWRQQCDDPVRGRPAWLSDEAKITSAISGRFGVPILGAGNPFATPPKFG